MAAHSRRPNRMSIGPDEVVVRTAELDRMRRKERAHDDYLTVLRWTYGRAEQARHGLTADVPAYADRRAYWQGWLDCLTEMSAALLRVTRGERP